MVSYDNSDDDTLVCCVSFLVLFTTVSVFGVIVVFNMPQIMLLPYPTPQSLGPKPQHGQVDWTKISTIGNPKCGKHGDLCHDLMKEEVGWRALLQSASQGSVLDIGVNNGGLTLLALSLGRQVLSADAMHRNVDSLKTEIISIRKAGASTLYETLPFDSDGDSKTVRTTGNSVEILSQFSLSLILSKEAVRVETTKIETLAQHHGLDKNVGILRISLAGYDGIAIRGAAGLFSQRKVKYVVMDVNPKHLLAKSDVSVLELLDIFNKQGFEIFMSCDNGIDSITKRELPVTCHRFSQLAEILASDSSATDGIVVSQEMFGPISKLVAKNQKSYGCCAFRLVMRRKDSPWDARLWWQQ